MNVSANKIVANGHVHVQYLHRQLRFHSQAIDMAAAHFDVEKYLHEHRHEGRTACGPRALHGHLHVVRSLHEPRTEGRSNALYWAADFGHFAVVKYLCEQGIEDGAQDALDAATHGPHPRIAAYLGTRFPLLMPIAEELF
ncbi:TPA: hypothetical protein N0F65_011849 [Lagenidium giganteum]|uniref:Uncharacterized protein n=1 Tax=Lagenidium giganteum TaxID=4803 RepID=A0AAV2Z2D9_9STRA|nr:TPA: hypothetical protein N0F65_011849 [Lagenidium giganteum]